MYLELNEDELKLIKEVSSITSTNYELKNNMLPVEVFTTMIENLKFEIDHQKEEYQKLEQNLREYYIPNPNIETYEYGE